ncbi:transcription initiation factor TFIID subunit 4 [Rhinolophus ferrumequinum]|uniref:transcription initiation factor TFIID subunit 4 n=1 Tax=Rhinolophus ferrumequinum TaxID=59479 RepID=UPI00140F8CEE|nr:transcription initiation factor TFIID subunit 4 [Rhinolophus ferrumequinum]
MAIASLLYGKESEAYRARAGQARGLGPGPGQFPGAATRPGSPRAAGGCGQGARTRAALPSATSSSMAPLTCEKHHCKSLAPAGQPPPPAPVDTPGASGRADPPVPLLRPRPAPRGPHLPWPAAGWRAPSRRRTKEAAAAQLPREHLNPAAAASAGEGFFFPFSKWRPMPVALLNDVIPLRLRAGSSPALGWVGRAAAGSAGGCREAPVRLRGPPRALSQARNVARRGGQGTSRPAGGCGPGAGAPLKTSGRTTAIRPSTSGVMGGLEAAPPAASGARPIGARSFDGAANGEHALRGRTWSAPRPSASERVLAPGGAAKLSLRSQCELREVCVRLGWQPGETSP